MVSGSLVIKCFPRAAITNFESAVDQHIYTPYDDMTAKNRITDCVAGSSIELNLLAGVGLFGFLIWETDLSFIEFGHAKVWYHI